MYRYTLELNEKQAIIVKEALEEFFRIRMNQWDMLADSLAMQNADLSPENPNHKEIFERYLNKRDHARIVLKSVGEIIFERNLKKTEEQLIAEDIWQVMTLENITENLIKCLSATRQNVCDS